MLEKHVCALADSGQEDWAPGGSKYVEWTTHKKYALLPHVLDSIRAQLLLRVRALLYSLIFVRVN